MDHGLVQPLTETVATGGRGKPHKFYAYPEADHRFMNYTFANYLKEAAELF